MLTLPVTTWHYKTDPPGVCHLGPMAQDWKAAFNLGDDDTMIWCVDANGVTIVSIQALHRLITDLQTANARLQSQLADLTTRLDSITGRGGGVGR
nr:hypothetical protein [Streptomyces natalensis]